MELDRQHQQTMAEDDYAAMEQDEDTGLAEYFQENERQTDEIQRAAQNKKATQSKTAPPSQKFSSNGYAKKKKYGTINLSKQEYAQIQTARMSKYTTFHEEMKDVDGIYAHDMFYVVRNHSLDTYEVLKRLDPAKDTEYIDIVMEEIENGTFSREESYRRFNEVLRSLKRKSGRNRNHDIRAESSRNAGKLVSGTEGDADRGRDPSSGNRGGAGDVKQNVSFDSETDAEYLEAVEQGDMETAQRMVDEAAQKAGYTIYAYHGSTNQEEKDTWNEKTKMWDTEYHRFTVFKKQYPEQVGHFFNSDMDNAGGYGSYLYRDVYLTDKGGNAYDATLNIANGRERRIIYDINNVRLVDKKKGTAHGVVPSTNDGRGSHIKSSSSGDKVSQMVQSVKQEFFCRGRCGGAGPVGSTVYGGG